MVALHQHSGVLATSPADLLAAEAGTATYREDQIFGTLLISVTTEAVGFEPTREGSTPLPP